MPLPLSPRQIQILDLLKDGQEAKAIARHLEMSVHTVNQHIGEIYRRLGVRKQSQAILKAIQLRIISAPYPQDWPPQSSPPQSS
jgi:DNA-binding NarL/FixJ family response regulator